MLHGDSGVMMEVEDSIDVEDEMLFVKRSQLLASMLVICFSMFKPQILRESLGSLARLREQPLPLMIED
jgi:hypothetical protein